MKPIAATPQTTASAAGDSFANPRRTVNVGVYTQRPLTRRYLEGIADETEVTYCISIVDGAQLA